MARPLIKAQVELQRTSGLDEDVVMNTLYFRGPDAMTPVDAATLVHGQLLVFYHAIDEYLSNLLNGNVHVKYFDMRDAEPRIPVLEDDMTLITDDGDPLPAECAVCLSYAAAIPSGEPHPGYFRGRIYLGPLAQASVTPFLSDVSIKDAAAAAITAAAQVMAFDEVGSIEHCVYSKTLDATASIDASFNPVVRGWVDNALDTQRRRGQAASSRTTYTV